MQSGATAQAISLQEESKGGQQTVLQCVSCVIEFLCDVLPSLLKTGGGNGVDKFQNGICWGGIGMKSLFNGLREVSLEEWRS